MEKGEEEEEGETFRNRCLSCECLVKVFHIADNGTDHNALQLWKEVRKTEREGEREKTAVSRPESVRLDPNHDLRPERRSRQPARVKQSDGSAAFGSLWELKASDPGCSLTLLL